MPFATLLARLFLDPLSALRAGRRTATERPAARSADALWSSVADLSSEALLLCDAAGRIRAANLAARRLCAHHDPFDGALPALASPLMNSRLQAALRHLDTVRPDTVLVPPTSGDWRQPDGTAITVRLQGRKVEVGGEALLAVRLERATQGQEAMGQFLAAMSHDLRTSLNGIAGTIDLLLRTPLSAEQHELLASSQQSSLLMRRLLDNALDLFRAEEGRLELEAIPFDVQEHLGSALRNFNALAARKGLALEVRWNTPQDVLLGDPYRICQVLGNLVDNAIKFTDHGSITVHVTTALSDKEGDGDACVLEVRVADTGPGIDPAHLATLFEPFAQGGGGVVRQHGGSGLGLALCRQLCERMNGSIFVHSRPSGGSIFRFQVPVRLAPDAALFVDTQPAPDTTRLPGMHVLVADDNHLSQNVLRRWLESQGMSVECVDDGEAAVRAVSAREYDLVLMDVSMPVMSGIDATRAIRGLARANVRDRARFAGLPIVGTSALALDADRAACLAAGMDDYITKPIQRDDLLARIAAALHAGQETRPAV